MKQFSYKKEVHSQTVVVDKLKSKINRQVLVFRILFIALGCSVVAYIIKNLSITEFDGYIICKNNKIRMVDDISLFKFYVKPGDRVNEGDTLFSYIYVDWINDMANPNNIVNVERVVMDAKKKVMQLNSELLLLQQSADSLLKIVSETSKEVDYGLVTIDVLEQKKWELFHAKERIKHTQRLIQIENNERRAVSNLNPTIGEVQTLGSYTSKMIEENKDLFGKAFHYRQAYTDMDIVELDSKVGSVVYEKESVLTFYAYNRTDISDLHVQMLLPPDKLSWVKDGLVMQIYSGKSYIGDAKVSLSSSYVKEVDSHKLDLFSQNREAVVIRLDILDVDNFASLYEIDNLPVKLRRSKWNDLLYKIDQCTSNVINK